MSPAANHQAVQWVALPAGIDNDRARVAVFVGPQLTVDGGEQVLGAFEDWTDWPARLSRTSFFVEFGDGTATAATIAAPPADSAAWRTLFPAATPLRSFQSAAAIATAFASYSVPAVDDVLRQAYARAATAAIGDLPLVRVTKETPADTPNLTDIFGDLAALYREPAYQALVAADAAVAAEDLANRANTALANRADPAGLVNLMPPPLTPVDHLANAVAFHRRDALTDPSTQAAARLDFHQLLTALGDHPALLRLLGLVTEITIPAAALRPTGRLRLRPLWTPLDPIAEPGRHDDLVPWTAYHRAGTTFAAGDGTHPPGLVDLPAEGFGVSQLDLDGALHKALTMVAGLSAPPADATTNGRAAPPALRSGGISLVRPDRAGHLHEAAANTSARQAAGADAVLDDAELTRGYRLDVHYAGRWHSLHHRDVRYTVAGHPVLDPVRDEGFLQDTVTTAATGNITYLHETVATWDGWSLAAPRPERTLSTDAQAELTRPDNTPLTSTNLKVDSAATPGTLPRLRFGAEYRLRLRTVDLAGNGPTSAEADAVTADVATPPFTYRRFEPVPAPEPVPLTRYPEGGSQTRLVVRGTTVTQSPLDPALTAPDIREFVPPKASLRMVELHGRLDAALGSSTPQVRAELYRIAARENGTLEHGLPGGELPYLPDPLCTGIAFFDLPGRESPDPLIVDFEYPTWHQPRPIRLRLLPFRSGPDPEPEWDATQRQLSVWLRPAKVWTIRIASKIADPTLLALPYWARDKTADVDHAALLASIAASSNAMLGPQRELTLVHAVPQPANFLDVTRFSVTRAGETPSVTIGGTVAVDADSTQRVDLRATWTEWIDTGTGEPRRRTSTTTVHARQIPPARPTPYYVPLTSVALSPPDSAYAFGDAKHRDLTFDVVATGRFHDHFPPGYAAGADAFVTTSTTLPWNLPSAVPPPPPQVSDVVPLLDRTELPAGSQRTGGWLRIYLARPWYVTGDGELLGVIAVDPQPKGPDADPPADRLYGLVCLAGQDETRFSANVPGLTPNRLLAGRARLDDVRLAELHNSGAWSPPLVSVVGYEPTFDPATNRWYCDINLDLGAAYFPFVRLAIVRWQPNASRYHTADDLMVSRVVLLDIVQTVPGRILTATRTAGGLVDVSLRGPTYTAVADQTSPDFQPAGRPTVTVRAQRRDPGIADDLIAWSDVGSPAALTRPFESFDETWHGTIRPPSAAPGERLRLLVTEEDHIAADPPAPGYAGRIVYADTIEL